MKRIAATTLALALALAAASGSAFANHDDDDYGRGQDDRYGYGYGNEQGNASSYDMARVVSVDPIVEPGRATQRQECWNEPQRNYQRGGYYRDDRRYRSSGPNGGTILGAIIGGSLGNLTGKGEGRHAATIAGAVIGGAIGHSIADDHRHYARVEGRVGYDDGYRGTVQQCRTISDYDRDGRVTGYNVSFEYNGQVYHTTTSHHPGDSIRVRVDVTADDDRVAGY